MIVKNVEKKENSTALFQVEVDAEAFGSAVEKAYKKEKNSIFVAGFRKGKAPRAVIEGMYGKNVFHEGAVMELADEAFKFAVDDSKLNTVGSPSIAEFNVDESGVLTVTFATDLYPQVTLGEYKGLEGEGEDAVVTDEDVDSAVEEARKRNARLIDVKRPVKMGDTISLDFEGFADGVPFEGGKSDAYTLEIGSGTFIPGFEDQMVGKELEKDDEIAVKFPENYDPKLAGKDAVFKVKVHSVKEPQYPELDDEFAKDVSEFDTLAEYKADLREKMLKDAQAQADMGYHSALMTKAIDNMTAVVPESMIAEKSEELLRSYADNMGLVGRASREDIFKMLGVTEDIFMQIVRPNAEKQVQSDLLLDKIIEVEAIEAGEDEKADFYKKVDEEYGADAENIKKLIDAELVGKDICRRKAAELIYNSGKKVAPKPAEEKTEAPAEDKDEKKPAKKAAPKKPKADAESAKEDAPKKTKAKAESAKEAAPKKTKAKAESADEAPAEKKPAAKRAPKKAKAETEEKAD